MTAPAKSPGTEVYTPSKRLLPNISRSMGLALSLGAVFIILAVFFHFQTDQIFFTPRNLSLLLRQASIVSILACGACVLMVMREIDLSTGSAVFLCGVVSATLTVQSGVPVFLAVLATLAVGVVLGIWQGFWVVKFGIPSFIVTLAGLLIFRGLGLLWTNSATVGPVPAGLQQLSENFIPADWSYVIIVAVLAVVVGFTMRRVRSSLPEQPIVRRQQVVRAALVLFSSAIALGLLAWAAGGFLGTPVSILWTVAVGFALWFVMSRTTFGRNAYLIGSSREAAEFAGINVRGHIFSGFVLMGALYGVAAVLLTARLASSTPSMGTNLELDAIAAAVIGGTALSGGIGTIPGAIAGAMLLATIDNGMSLMNVSSSAQAVVKGLVLLAALGLNAYLLRRR